MGAVGFSERHSARVGSTTGDGNALTAFDGRWS